jgi:hypothetical protein
LRRAQFQESLLLVNSQPRPVPRRPVAGRTVGLAAACLALTACGGEPPGQQIAFELNVKVTDFGGSAVTVSSRSAGQRAIAVYGQSVFLAWHDNRGKGSVVVARSDDGGATFAEGTPIGGEEAVPSKRAHPALAVDRDGGLYVAWADIREAGPGIYVARSTDGGRTFAPGARVNDAPVAYAGNPALAVDEAGRLFVAWEDYRHDLRSPDVYFSRSADEGRSFERNFLVNDDRPPDAPLVVLESVVPEPTPGGTPAPRTLDPAAEEGPALGRRAPSLAADSRRGVFVAWQDGRRGSPDIYLARSTDGGASFGPNVRVNDDQGQKWRGLPSLALGPNGEVCVAWEDRRNDRPDIFFSKSTDGGLSFLPGLQINRIVLGGSAATAQERFPPGLAVDSRGIITVTWRGPRALPRIYVARSASGGQTFSDPVVVDDAKSPVAPTAPNLTVDAAGRVFVAWADNRIGGGLSHEVFLARSR